MRRAIYVSITLTALMGCLVVGITTVHAAGASRQRVNAAAERVDALKSLSGRRGRETADDPSGVPAPSASVPGWRLVYRDTFTHSAPVGSFSGCAWSETMAHWNCSGLPRTVRKSVAAYPDWIPDTQRTGYWVSSKVLSINDHALNFNLRWADHNALVAAVVPKIPAGSDGMGRLYGAYAIRFRASYVDGYGLCVLLWPDAYSSGAWWPEDGEVDFPEGTLGSSTDSVVASGINGFLHYEGSAGVQQDQVSRLGSFSRWHTTVIEWTKSTIRFILDGRVVGTFRSHIPRVPMHLVLQTETTTVNARPNADASGKVQVAWVAAFAPA